MIAYTHAESRWHDGQRTYVYGRGRVAVEPVISPDQKTSKWNKGSMYVAEVPQGDWRAYTIEGSEIVPVQTVRGTVMRAPIAQLGRSLVIGPDTVTFHGRQRSTHVKVRCDQCGNVKRVAWSDWKNRPGGCSRCWRGKSAARAA